MRLFHESLTGVHAYRVYIYFPLNCFRSSTYVHSVFYYSSFLDKAKKTWYLLVSVHAIYVCFDEYDVYIPWMQIKPFHNYHQTLPLSENGSWAIWKGDWLYQGHVFWAMAEGILRPSIDTATLLLLSKTKFIHIGILEASSLTLYMQCGSAPLEIRRNAFPWNVESVCNL